MKYQPIENYGIVGDLNTVALIGLNGHIDFLCFPYFDSPTVFGALLDAEKGGQFSIAPVFARMKTKQLYLPDTNVLLTRFLSTSGVGEITDFMPLESGGHGGKLVRRVKTIRGEVNYEMRCRPRFNYGRSSHRVELVSPTTAVFTAADGLQLRLISTVPLATDGQDIVAGFVLGAEQAADFLLESAGEAPVEVSLDKFVDERLVKTVNYWRSWMARSTYSGRWMETVNRSVLVLKLLTSKRYGSAVAAPTFGLPEAIGGARNWDYRYTWIRDASFTIYTFLRLGYTEEARHFMEWVEKLCEDIQTGNPLGIMYAIDGKRQVKEEILESFEGYQGSAPVRIGNDACQQLQLDIYGELLNAAYLYNAYGEEISYDFWNNLQRQVDWLCENWNQPDDGIWEVRGGRKHFLYSRLQCWVAFDRAIKIALARSFPLKENWKKERDAVFKSIYTEFWDKEKKAFMQFPGSDTVDASALLMPMVHFISPTDPKWLSTLKRIEEELVSDSLVYRYNPSVAASDGFITHEGTFSMCTFWYAECLSRSGQAEKARFCFEKMLGYANHLGLYSEQLGFEGEHLGNFPQAFTHFGLIGAAYHLDKCLDRHRTQE